MNYKKIYMVVLTGLIGLTALALLLTVFLPYGKLKSLADGFMPDGDFKSLKENNVIVFKILLGVTGLVLLTMVVGLGTGKIKIIRTWSNRYFSDLVEFFKEIKLTRIEVLTLGALLLIIAAAIIFRLVRIYDGMTHDESYTFMVFSSSSLFTALSNYHLPNNHVLNSLLILLSTHIFGIKPWAVRLPALLAGLLLIPTTYALAKSMYDRYTALTGALLVAVLPGAILYSTSARGYSLVALFTILTLWLANYLRRSKNIFAWFLLVLFSAFGFYSVPVFLFPFGMVFAWLFFENLAAGPGIYGSRVVFIKYWLLAGLATAVLVLILYTPIFIYSGADKVFSNPFVTPEDWIGYLPSIPGHLLNVWREWTSGLSPVWTYGLILGFLLSLFFHKRLSHQRFPLQVAVILWITVLIVVQRPVRVTKIWVFLQAPFMIWCAAGWMGLLKNLRLAFARHISVAAIVTGAAVLMMATAAIRAVPAIPQRWEVKSPAEYAILQIEDLLEPRDRIIVGGPYDAPMWYYARLHGLNNNLFDKHAPFDRLFVIVSSIDNQTLLTVLQRWGPEMESIDLGKANLIMNYQNLDIYLIPHRREQSTFYPSTIPNLLLAKPAPGNFMHQDSQTGFGLELPLAASM